MRSLLRLLLVLTIVLCGSHLCEPVAAHASGVDVALHVDADSQTDDGDDAGKPAGKLAHGGHHHCPVAADQHVENAFIASPAAALLFASSRTTLDSLSQAPPLQPPSA